MFLNIWLYLLDYINDTLQKYLNNFCITYLDNILIFSEDELEHKLYVKKVLSRL